MNVNAFAGMVKVLLVTVTVSSEHVQLPMTCPAGMFVPLNVIVPSALP